MNKHSMIGISVAAVLVFSFAIVAWAQPEIGDDKSLSPYFFVKSDDPAVDQLPLKSTSAKVNVAGVIADVLVTQVYKNEGKRPIEALYVFPASSRAAVYGMKMMIGDRTITAQIKEREMARKEYEDAKRQGKSASLLEQERPNVFQMNVANIMPGDEIKVEMSYTELLVPTDGVYEFVYPTVVGPRYSNQKSTTAAPAAQNDKWIANPYLKEGEATTTTFDIKAGISTGLPIQEISCTTHKVEIKYDGPANAVVNLKSEEKSGGNRDFILKYRLAGGKIDSGLMLYEGEKENFFLMMVQPPKSVEPKQIPPREYIFIVDISGSMHGYPLDISKKLLQELIGNLRSTDTFNVLLFAGSSSILSEESLPATQENIKKAVDVINRQQGGGGTEILPALRRALTLPRSKGTSRSIIVATDGYVSVEAETFDEIRKNLGEANLFAFGIGTSVNRHLMECMARAGMGEPFIITKPDEAAGKADKFRKYIQSPVLTGIKCEFGSFQAKSVEPPAVPDVLAERPVIVFGKWTDKPEGTITVTGTSGEGEYKQEFKVADVRPKKDNLAIRYLWARHRIAVLADNGTIGRDPEIKQEVTKLGLEYSLLTAYTSFVAVDSQIRADPNQMTTVNQPLPLPEGVSNLAVGGGAGMEMLKMSYAPSAASPSPKEYRESDSFAVSEKPQSNALPTTSVVKAVKKDAKKNGRISVSNIVTSGDLTGDKIREVINRDISKLEENYDKALKNNPKLSGELGFEIYIDGGGGVKKVKIVSGEISDKDLEKQILAFLKGLQFPNKAGKDLEIIFRLIFRP